MKEDRFDVRRKLTHPQDIIPKEKQKAGSTKNKYPVYLDDGKTVIFVKDKKKVQEVIERYRNRDNP